MYTVPGGVSTSGRRSPPVLLWGGTGDFGRQVEFTEKYKGSSKVLRKKVRGVKDNCLKRKCVTFLKGMRGKELILSIVISSF